MDHNNWFLDPKNWFRFNINICVTKEFVLNVSGPGLKLNYTVHYRLNEDDQQLKHKAKDNQVGLFISVH